MPFRLLFALFLLSFPVVAQITVSGRVVDKESREPLPFATVGVKGQSVYTITNLNGEFDFHIPERYHQEMLVISMLGYKNIVAPIWSLDAGPFTFEMLRSTTVLQEVVVSEVLTGGDVLRSALARIEDNFPMKPFLMDGFYRDVKKVAGVHISLLEAAVRIYDENYEEPRNKFRLREHVKLLEVRRSLGYENKYTTFFDQDNLLEDLLLHNNIRYRQIDAQEALFRNVVREEDSYYDDHEIFVLSGKQGYYLKIFVRKDNFAIVRLEYENRASDEVLQKKRDLVSRFGGIKKVIEFREFNGKMYLNYMTMTSVVNWHDVKSGKFKFSTELIQQLMINHVESESPARIGATERMRNYGLQYQHQAYNKKFWDQYNVIKQTPLDSLIVHDLEKVAPLQLQFEDN
jgi:hypothetical protein